MKGQSNYDNSTGFHMALYMDIDGFDSTGYEGNTIEKDGETGDPFLAVGINSIDWTYGQAQTEFGLLGSHRIRINSSGVRIWTAGDVWEDPLVGADKTRTIKMELLANNGATITDFGILCNADGEGYSMSIRLPDNIDDTKDIKITYTFKLDNGAQTSYMRWAAATKTDNTETRSWNIVNGEAFWQGARTTGRDFKETYTIDAADIDVGDTILMLVRCNDASARRLAYNAYLEYEVV